MKRLRLQREKRRRNGSVIQKVITKKSKVRKGRRGGKHPLAKVNVKVVKGGELKRKAMAQTPSQLKICQSLSHEKVMR